SGGTSHSPRLVEKLVEQAITQCRALDHGRVAERAALRNQGVMLAGIAAATALIITLGPAYLRHGLSAILTFSRSAEASTPYRIEVLPGNRTVPRGADQAIKAKLVGFNSSDVAVMMRSDKNASYERVPLIPGKDGAFEGVLFHLE